MARANIAKLLEQRSTEPDLLAEPPASTPRQQAPSSPTKEERAAARPHVQAAAPTASPEGSDSPRELYKKGAVLYVDQLEALDAQARRLNQAKSSTELPRITANTLLRIAVDMLLAHTSELSGDDEEQLRKSMSL